MRKARLGAAYRGPQQEVGEKFGLAITFLALVMCLGGSSLAAEKLDFNELEGGAKLDALIEAVSDRQRGMETLQAKFIQIKESTLLAEPVESSGTLTFQAPDRVRWDYTTPELMTVLVADGRLTTYHPGLGRAEVIKVSKGQSRLVGIIAGSQSLDEMRSRFRISLADRADLPYRLTLEPTTMVMKRRLAKVNIEVDRELLLPIMVEYLEADGDRTRYTFSELELDRQVDDALFVLELGDDVSIDTIDAASSR